MNPVEHHFSGPDGLVLVVRVPRELSHETADELRQQVARHIPNRDGAGVVLDMAAVEMITSIGIAAMLQVQETCRDRGATLVIAALSARQTSFLKMLKLDRKFPLITTVEEAVSKAAGGSA